MKKLRNEYFDLRLSVGDKSIDVHKIVVCERSDLIKMLYRKEMEKNREWPPVNILKMTLPDGVDEEGFTMAIKIIYEDDIALNENIVPTIRALLYLCVDHSLICELLVDWLPEELGEIHIGLLVYLIETYGDDDNWLQILEGLMGYYGKELINHIELPHDLKYYGMGDSIMNMVDRTPSMLRRKRFPDVDTDSTLSKPDIINIGHIEYNGQYTFSALDITWELVRFYVNHGYDDRDEILRIYVDENFKSDDLKYKDFNIKVTFITYYKICEPQIDTVIVNVVPNKYKADYMRSNYKSNSLTSTLDYPGEPIRSVLIFEELSLKH